MRSLGSNVVIGLDPDGFSSYLDMMKTVAVFGSGGQPSGCPSGDPEEILSSEGPEDAETSPPCGASLLYTILHSVLWRDLQNLKRV